MVMIKVSTPRGIRNNNPLNIRKGNSWQGERRVQTDAQFEQFESMQYGIRAGFKILRNYMSGYGGRVKPLVTVHDIISRWAPASENDTCRYIYSVCRMTGLHEYEKISYAERSKMISLVDAMIRLECGRAVDTQLIESAYDMLTI